jgi:general secretion pathway protein G
MFKADVGRYPTTQEGLRALLKKPDDAENWDGPYIKKDDAMNDPWGHPYNYQSPGQHNDYDLYSYGPEKQLQPGEKKPAVANW